MVYQATRTPVNTGQPDHTNTKGQITMPTKSEIEARVAILEETLEEVRTLVDEVLGIEDESPDDNEDED